MTSIQKKVIKPKLGLLELAKQLGTVSQVCNVMGHSPDSIYRVKALSEQGGQKAPMDPFRKRPILKSRVLSCKAGPRNSPFVLINNTKTRTPKEAIALCRGLAKSF